ncbi:Uncharacterised protein [Vibrio cholerae]|nr:Uncharacterised protein [Vibrio cholerae]
MFLFLNLSCVQFNCLQSYIESFVVCKYIVCNLFFEDTSCLLHK